MPPLRKIFTNSALLGCVFGSLERCQAYGIKAVGARRQAFTEAVAYCSVNSTCTTVWPTALSVLRSILSMVSDRVCHVGPKLLSAQSG